MNTNQLTVGILAHVWAGRGAQWEGESKKDGYINRF